MSHSFQTDYRLWQYLYLPTFLALGFINLAISPPHRNFWSIAYALFWGPRDERSVDLFGMFLIQLVCLVPLAFFVSWILQCGAVMAGLRLDRK